MKLGDNGEAFFVQETDNDQVQRHLVQVWWFLGTRWQEEWKSGWRWICAWPCRWRLLPCAGLWSNRVGCVVKRLGVCCVYIRLGNSLMDCLDMLCSGRQKPNLIGYLEPLAKLFNYLELSTQMF